MEEKCCKNCKYLFGTACLPLCTYWDQYVILEDLCKKWEELYNAT